MFKRLVIVSRIDGNTYTESNNTAIHTLTNSNGCDSVVTLDLTIKYSSSVSDVQTSCVNFEWNGITYTESGTYTFDTTNAVGCDSTAILNLTINNSNTVVDTHTACDSFTWIDGNTYTESNSTATYTFVNSMGCDSVVTLDLLIINPSFTTVEEEVCDSIVWNGATYTESGVYTFSTTNYAGCDSTVTLNLVVNTNTSQPVIEQLYSTTLTTDSSYSYYLWFVDGIEFSNDITVNIQTPGVYLLSF